LAIEIFQALPPKLTKSSRSSTSNHVTMSVRLGAPALCRPLKYSRESGLSGARCSCHAVQAAISGAVRLCFARALIHSRTSVSRLF